MSEEEIETPVEVEEPKPEVDLSLSQLAGLGAVSEKTQRVWSNKFN